MLDIRKPVRVINSCETIEQVNTALLYCVNWAKLNGYGPRSRTFQFLYLQCSGKVLSFLGAGPGRDRLNRIIRSDSENEHRG